MQRGYLTLFYELPSLLIAEVGVGRGPQAEGLPEQDAKAPHVALRGIAACKEVRQCEWATHVHRAEVRPALALQPGVDKAQVP